MAGAAVCSLSPNPEPLRVGKLCASDRGSVRSAGYIVLSSNLTYYY